MASNFQTPSNYLPLNPPIPQGGARLLDLPPELLILVMQETVFPRSLLNLRTTNRQLRDIFKLNSRHIVPHVSLRGDNPILCAAHCINAAIKTRGNCHLQIPGCCWDCCTISDETQRPCRDSHPPELRDLHNVYCIRKHTFHHVIPITNHAVRAIIPMCMLYLFFWLFILVLGDPIWSDLIGAIKTRYVFRGNILQHFSHRAMQGEDELWFMCWGRQADTGRFQRLPLAQQERILHNDGAFLNILKVPRRVLFGPQSGFHTNGFYIKYGRLHESTLLFFRTWHETLSLRR